MWWKVELQKGGEVASCKPCDGPKKKGNLLRFVEADSKEEAVAQVHAWFRRYREQQRDYQRRRTVKLREQQACTQCAGKSGYTPVPGKDRCQPCLDRKAVWRASFAERGAPPRPKADPLVTRARYDSLHGLNLQATTVLKQFDQLGPDIFRVWLMGIIEDAKMRTRGELPEAAE